MVSLLAVVVTPIKSLIVAVVIVIVVLLVLIIVLRVNNGLREIIFKRQESMLIGSNQLDYFLFHQQNQILL